MEAIQRFDPSSENFALVKQLLKAQGMETDWLTSSLLKHSFGFVYLTQKLVKSPTDKYHVHGFVTCRSVKESRSIWIDLLCSRCY